MEICPVKNQNDHKYKASCIGESHIHSVALNTVSLEYCITRALTVQPGVKLGGKELEKSSTSMVADSKVGIKQISDFKIMGKQPNWKQFHYMLKSQFKTIAIYKRD